MLCMGPEYVLKHSLRPTRSSANSGRQETQRAESVRGVVKRRGAGERPD